MVQTREWCRLPETRVLYAATSDFTGPVTFTIGALFDDGTARRYTYTTDVR